ncbi:bifunctional RNase H/acid phosphatase [Salinifilum aidingensis]
MGRRLIVEADGGSRGNPGLAGCGAVVRDADTGEVLAERAEQLGVATNNVAEYQGLIEGLRAARDCDPESLTVRMDSKLVVEQMAGRWRVKHENLQPLAAQAKQLVAELPGPEFVWVPREQNKHADRLANAAMDGEDITEREAVLPEVPAAPATAAPASEGAAARSAPEQRAGDWLGAVGAPTRLLLLRHGQTSMSVDKRYSGRGDVELTELGRSQARAAAERLAKMTGVAGPDGDPAPIVASPLVRTRQTADEVAAATGGTCELRDGLVETDFGEWEGLTFAETSERYPELHGRWLGDPTVAPPGGESLEHVAERVSAACDDLLQRYAGRTVVVVSHVTPIKALLRRALDVGPGVFYRLHLDLASLSVVEHYPDGNASVRLVNDISHWS